MRSDDGSSRVPSAAQGRACRNAPECGAAAAIRRAMPAESGAADNTLSSWTLTNGASHTFCAVAYGGWTGAEPVRVCHSVNAVVNDGSLVPATSRRFAGSSSR